MPERLPEEFPENLDPLNQRAKALLSQAGQDPDPTSLYLLQLAQWSLDQGNHGLQERFRADLAHAVLVLTGKEPAAAMKFLLEGENGPQESRLSARDLHERSPLEAAQEVLNALHRALQLGESQVNPA